MSIDPTHPAVQALADAINGSGTTGPTPAGGPAPGDNSPSIVWAVIDTIQVGPPPTLTLFISGSAQPTPGIKYLIAYEPVVGDTVMCTWVGSDLVVVSAVATGAVPTALERLYPVGEVYFSLTATTAAAVKARLGFGTWAAWGAGTMLGLIGGSIGASGGADSVTLTATNIPSSGLSISGSLSGGSISGSASGSLSGGTTSTADHQHGPSAGGLFAAYGQGGADTDASGGPNNVNSDSVTGNELVLHSHTVAVSGSLTVSGSATGSLSGTVSGGGDTAFSIIPSYTGIYGWIRTA